MQSRANLTYAGHATVLIEMDGVRLLTDPLFRRRVGHLRRQVAMPDLAQWRRGRGQIDAVLISHLHWDHLDLPSLRLLGRTTTLIAPRGAARYLRRAGVGHVIEIGRFESLRIGDVVITATPANHNGQRTPFSPQVDSLGYIVRGSYEVYFAGDTDLFPEMADLGEDLDIALLPVWGWGPTLGPGHLDPLRAAQSLVHLSPRLAIPIHWGTYAPLGMGWLQPAFLRRPPLAFAAHVAALAPQVAVRILQPGQSLRPFPI